MIAKIVTEYRVVINRGHKDGVENGMRFVIFDPGEEILDPKTGESLGNLEIVKAKVEVINVQEKMSTAKTYEYTSGPSGIAAAFVNIERGPLKKLPLDEEALKQVKTTSVKVGDLVRQILD